MIIITDTECEQVPGSGISERVIFPEQRPTLEIMYATLLRLERAAVDEAEPYIKAVDKLERELKKAKARIAELEVQLKEASNG